MQEQKRKYMKIVRIAVFGFLLFCTYLLLLYVIQDRLIYHPDRNYITPQEAGVPVFQENPFTMSDGTKVMTWLAKGNKDKPVILFFHGNSRKVSDFVERLMLFVNSGYTVIAVEYRGFGNTLGKMSEKKAISDASEVFHWLKSEGYQKIIAIGYSLGCATVIGLAEINPVDGLVLLAPFTSLEQMVVDTPYPFARYVLKDPYYSDKRILSIKAPLLIFHGKNDPVIPYTHSEKLYHLSASDNKKLILTEDDTHSSLFFQGNTFETILSWIED